MLQRRESYRHLQSSAMGCSMCDRYDDEDSCPHLVSTCRTTTMDHTSRRGGKWHDNEHDSSYGWFIEISNYDNFASTTVKKKRKLESDDSFKQTYTSSLSPIQERRGPTNSIIPRIDDLSLKVLVAPMRNDELDSALCWAQAADTVDSVLEDIFTSSSVRSIPNKRQRSYHW